MATATHLDNFFPDDWDEFIKVEKEARYVRNIAVFHPSPSRDFLNFHRMKSVISQTQEIHNTILNTIDDDEKGDFFKIKAYFEQEQLPKELQWSIPALGLPCREEEPSFRIVSLGLHQDKKKEMIIANTQQYARKIRDFGNCSNMRLSNSQNYGELFDRNGIQMIPIMGIFYSHYNLPIEDIDKFRLAIKELLSALEKRKRILESFLNLCFSLETELNFVNSLEFFKEIPFNREAFKIQLQAVNAARDHLQKLKVLSYELRANDQNVEYNIRFLQKIVSQIHRNIHFGA